MSAGAILTIGLGSFGSVNLLPTLGYLSGTAPTPSITTWGNMPRRRKNESDDDADIREIVEIAMRAFGDMT